MLRVSLLTLLTSLAALLFCLKFYPLQQVSGRSMQPTLADRQWLLLDRLVYHLGRPRYGDRVVFSLPGSTKNLIKRVMLLPGDPLLFSGNSLLLSDRLLPLTHIQKAKLSSLSRVPQNNYFLLGDNLNLSLDSRDFGFIDRTRISGKVRF